ncbi:MAG TPA: hypothetical protein VF624_02535 [Tepidisphaeraceae bacterium]
MNAYNRPMHPLLDFYRRTWWLWLAFTAMFVLLGLNVSFVFLILIPALLVYSVYFGMVRASEEERRVEETRGFDVRPLERADAPSQGQPPGPPGA